MLHITSCERANESALLLHATIGCPIGTRLHRIVRVTQDQWMLWTATKDFVYGTYLLLNHDGSIERVTARQDEGDEIWTVRPSDYEILRNSAQK